MRRISISPNQLPAPGQSQGLTIDTTSILLCNVDGEYFAIEDVCTHDGSPLDGGRLDGACIECPRHGARFDLRTGAALTLPAFLPVETFRVTKDGDVVTLEFP